MSPDNFGAFWAAVDDELACQPMRPEVLPIRRHSTEDFEVSAVRLTSTGPNRIFAYLSVPRGRGPFPALLELPRYGSVNEVPDWNDRLRYVVLTLMHRGQRLADTVSSASYPGLLTMGIEDPNTYAYRGVIADCIRGAEFLSDQPEVDRHRVAARGSDVGLLVAARRPLFKAVVVESVFLYRALEARRRSDAYPLEELNDYLNCSPAAQVAMERTMALFDPLLHVPSVRASTLVNITEDGELDAREWLAPLVATLGGPVETYLLTRRGAIDADWSDAWLARQLGVAPMSRFRPTPL